MCKEATKSRASFEKYLTGRILDIGGGPDPITPEAIVWDRDQGDAQEMRGARPGTFDVVFSSHCLEHLRNPQAALARWWSLVKPGGYLIVVAPEADAYEQGFWPSRFNPQHHFAFSASTDISWCPANLNLAELVGLLPGHKLLRLEVVVDGPPPPEPADTTLTGSRAQVEMVVHKPAGAPRLVGSILPEVFACPQCRRQVRALGRSETGALLCKCEACGAMGSFAPRDATPLAVPEAS
jgi:SAM-dependent methyltransferase